jgi:hypothetical protein
MGTYVEIAKVQRTMKRSTRSNKDSNSSTAPKRKNALDKSKRQLLHMSLFTSLCLLLNLITTLITTTGLGEWSASTNVWLDCSISESFFTRDWDKYQLSNNQQVCTAREVTTTQGGTECVGPCTWLPEKHADFMMCSLEEGFPVQESIAGFPKDGGDFGEKYT